VHQAAIGEWERRDGVEDSTLAFGFTDRGFASPVPVFSYHRASAFSKQKSLATCPMYYNVSTGHYTLR